MFRIVLTCGGVPKDIGANAAADITEEFTHRPWHRNARCGWDGNLLTLQADNDFDSTGDALADEFADALAACIAPGFDGSIAKVSVVKLDDIPSDTPFERTREDYSAMLRLRRARRSTQSSGGAVKRVPAEYMILASFGATAVFWVWLALFGHWRSYGNRFLGAVILLAFVGLGATSCWLLLKKKVAGAWLCVVFYGIQILSFPLPVGAPFSFHSLPTLNFRLNNDPAAPISLNVLALILFVVSLALLAHYREQELSKTQGST